MDDTDRDVLETVRLLESCLETAQAATGYANLVKVLGDVVDELTRLRKIEVAVREYMYSEKRIPDINDLNHALEHDTDG
jgi:hypothetical protein